MISINYCRTSSNANPRQLISLTYCCKLHWCRSTKGCIFAARDWRPDLNPMRTV